MFDTDGTMFNETYPAVIVDHGEFKYYIPYKYDALIGPEQWWHDGDLVKPVLMHLQARWHSTIWMALCYILGIHLIQKTMASRKALELKLPLILWNSALALFSLVGAIRTSEEIWFIVRSHSLLDSVSFSPDPYQPAGFWMICFGISKAIEFGDTVFVVLRKKKLIFLHWYHHAIVLVYVWHAIKEGTGGGRWFVFMNFAVHTLMYAYYAISAAGFRLPRVLSMAITSLQTTQMLIGVGITLIVLCCKLQGRIMQHSYENLLFCFGIYASFAVLFSKFFVKSYMKTDKTQ